MKIVKMAGRSYLGYRLKAASILVFSSIAFTLILGGTNLLYNSFNIWFGRSSDLSLPRFLVTAKPGFDLDNEFGIRDIALSDSDRAAVSAKLSRDFAIGDLAILYGQLSKKSDQDVSFYAFVIGVDFGAMDSVFPFFKGKLAPERIAEYKEKPLALVNAKAADRLGSGRGTEFVLVSNNYYRDFNAMKLSVREVMDDGLGDGDLMSMPTAFVDISQLEKLFGFPEGVGTALVLTPKRRTPVFSLGNAALGAKIERTIRPLGLGLRDCGNISRSMASSFALYRNVINAFMAVLAVVLCLSVSSNLFMSFQDRRADFGLYKAFGCGNGRVFLLILAENAFGVALPFAIAVLANVLIGVFLKPVTIMGGFFVLSPGFTDFGMLTLSSTAAAICILSVLQSYRYLARLEPVSIMREE